MITNVSLRLLYLIVDRFLSWLMLLVLRHEVAVLRRTNRGGDRVLNRAIHTIATVRMRDCPTTKAYVARRTAIGKTIREIKRCLKRYIARELYRTLEPPP